MSDRDLLPYLPPQPWPKAVPLGAKCYSIGTDPGQLQDPTAICIMQHDVRCTRPPDPLAGDAGQYDTHYLCLGAETLLGQSYVDVAQRLALLCTRLYDRDNQALIHLLLDTTGVGLAVADMLMGYLPESVMLTRCTISSGSADKGSDSILWKPKITVSKAWLVSSLQAKLSQRRVHLPASAAMEAMLEELRRYEIRVTPHGNETAGVFATGKHDDLATALALATAGPGYAPVRYDVSLDALPSARL